MKNRKKNRKLRLETLDARKLMAANILGDFVNDGYDDLAVGSPREDIGRLKDAGVVSIFYGSKKGLRTNNARNIHQDSRGIQGTAEKHDQFGYAVTVGDFDNDGYDDLAVGAHYDSVSGKANAGVVNVIFGSRTRELSMCCMEPAKDL